MFIVYRATHVPTGKIYVGRTKNTLEQRAGQHWATTHAKRKKFHNFLHTTKMNDWVWEVLHTFTSKADAIDCELHYIDSLNLYKCGLNSPTGMSAENEKARKEASERMRNYRAENPETWHKGRKGVYSEETLNLMRLAKLRSPTRRTFSEADRHAASVRAKNSKQIKELKSGLVFNSISMAARYFNLRRESVRDVVSGRRSHTSGLVFILESTD